MIKSVRRGFTLIEVILVIALLGMIMYIAVGNFESLVAAFESGSWQDKLTTVLRKARYAAAKNMTQATIRWDEEKSQWIVRCAGADAAYSSGLDKAKAVMYPLVATDNVLTLRELPIGDFPIRELIVEPSGVMTYAQIQLEFGGNPVWMRPDPFSSTLFEEPVK